MVFNRRFNLRHQIGNRAPDLLLLFIFHRFFPGIGFWWFHIIGVGGLPREGKLGPVFGFLLAFWLLWRVGTFFFLARIWFPGKNPFGWWSSNLYSLKILEQYPFLLSKKSLIP